MNVIVFGATGMVGQGVLCECLLDSDVQRVTTVGRGWRYLPKLAALIGLARRSALSMART
jgi:predicted GTPase